MKSLRPQLALRLGPDDPKRDATDAGPWRGGASLSYLGRPIRLQLDTDRKEALLEGDTLHLPLPPQARPRQVRDAAEAWLRAEADALFRAIAARRAGARGLHAPRIALSFSARGDWVRPIEGILRCNWRLIAQPPAVIETVLERAIAALPAPMTEIDLFAALA